MKCEGCSKCRAFRVSRHVTERINKVYRRSSHERVGENPDPQTSLLRSPFVQSRLDVADDKDGGYFAVPWIALFGVRPSCRVVECFFTSVFTYLLRASSLFLIRNLSCPGFSLSWTSYYASTSLYVPEFRCLNKWTPIHLPLMLTMEIRNSCGHSEEPHYWIKKLLDIALRHSNKYCIYDNRYRYW